MAILADGFSRAATKRLFGPCSLVWFVMVVLATFMGRNATANTGSAPPDPVLEWIQITNDTVLAPPTNPLVTSRNIALVSTAVFDAVNGIETRFQPFFVKPNAPQSASARAAAVQAAYAILLDLYPGQSSTLAADRMTSLNAILQHEKASSVNAGTAWGQTVADAIWAWRQTDGNAPLPPPFVGVLGIESSLSAVGVWRPTPPLNASGAGPQFATMTPWVLTRPSQFRLPPPLSLTSPEFAADLNEVETMGVYSGSGRSADQSELALFWAGNTPLYWDRIASQLSTEHRLSLTENARLFALLNVAMADAAIACWDSKYRYVFWRPITTIRTGFTGGPAPNPTWEPWLDSLPSGTPAHPEYPSGHSTVSGSAAFILAAAFGNNTAFTVTSDVRAGMRSFASFSDAVAEIADARVFGGIHYRTSCVRGHLLGQAVADYVSKHAFRAFGDD